MAIFIIILILGISIILFYALRNIEIKYSDIEGLIIEDDYLELNDYRIKNTWINDYLMCDIYSKIDPYMIRVHINTLNQKFIITIHDNGVVSESYGSDKKKIPRELFRDIKYIVNSIDKL